MEGKAHGCFLSYGDTLAMNISEEDDSISIELAITTASYYGISQNEAKKMAEEITCTVLDNWERLALEYGLSRGAIEQMKPAFGACHGEN